MELVLFPSLARFCSITDEKDVHQWPSTLVNLSGFLILTEHGPYSATSQTAILRRVKGDNECDVTWVFKYNACSSVPLSEYIYNLGDQAISQAIKIHRQNLVLILYFLCFYIAAGRRKSKHIREIPMASGYIWK
jgi:hypothetical protein